MTALKCCCDLPAVTPSGLCWGCGHPREVVTSNLDLADKVRAVYNRCFLGRHELNVNDAAVLMEAVRFLHPHDETPAPHAGYGCGPKTPWDCLCGEPSCAYCGAQKTSEEPG